MARDHIKAARILSTLLAGLLLVGLLCPLTQASAATETWAIYWYLCGSDLESEDGSATEDLDELLSVEPAKNVTVVIQTGGTDRWHFPDIEEDASQRYVYDTHGINLVDESRAKNMGKASTLADFLTFCTENYPADHTMVLFWNHGGGTVGGVAYDEQYDYDSLSLKELDEAFASVFGDSPDEPALDIVAFDACLMASIDNAAMLKDYAHYMLASEEMEPSTGYDYAALMQAFRDNANITPEELGKQTCDDYYAACKKERASADVTQSLVDLTKLDPLLVAYNNLGVETLTGAYSSSNFLSSYTRGAKAAENYGGNTREDGYSNMVDLGDLVRNNESLLSESGQSVLDALEDCVVYSVSGRYRDKASGLSCFHSYDRDREALEGFSTCAASEAFVYLNEYIITGKLSSEAKEFINNVEVQSLPEDMPETQAALELPEEDYITELQTVSTLDLEDFPVSVTDDGYAMLDLGSEIASQLSGVYVQLFYVDYEEDIMLYLGRDNDIYADWEEGVFYDNFTGYWGAIDDCLVYMELIYEGVDYDLYTVPVLLNGEEYNLRVSYDYEEDEYTILGARKGILNYGMSDRNLVQLEPGDVITTLHYATTVSGDSGDLELYPVDELTVTRRTSFETVDMGDGDFLYMFEMEDVSGNYAFSEIVYISVEGDEIWLEEI